MSFARPYSDKAESRPSPKLLDLDPTSLARIAAFVSEGRPCPALAKLPFQVVCDDDHWINLNGLRETCRALRDATRLAICGLELVKVFARDVSYKYRAMPLATALTIPCIRVLDKCFGDGVVDLVQSYPGLRHVALRQSWDRPVDVPLTLAKLSGDTLQILEIECTRRTEDTEAARIIFASLKGNLRELSLTNFGGEQKVPLLSQETAKMVEKVQLANCDGIDEILKLFNWSSNLRSLRIEECKVSNVALLETIVSSTNVSELSYVPYWIARSFALEDSLEMKPPANLTSFKYSTSNWGTCFPKVIPMLITLSRQLQKLDICFDEFLTERILRRLSSINFRSDCEVSFSVCDRKMYGAVFKPNGMPRVLMVGPLRFLPNLTSLRIAGVHLKKDFNMLRELPRIEKVEITNCIVDGECMVKFASEAKSLTSMILSYCRDIDGKWFRRIGGSRHVTLNALKEGNFHRL